MSNSKAARRKGLADVVKDIQNKQKRDSGTSRQNFSGLGSADFGGVTSSASSGVGSTNSITSHSSTNMDGVLQTVGDTMIGPISFYLKSATVANGVINVSKGEAYSSRVIVTGQSAAADDLEVILGATHAGQILFFQPIQAITLQSYLKTATAWASGTSYSVGDVVLYSSQRYTCYVAHTSSGSILPTDTTKWYRNNIRVTGATERIVAIDEIVLLQYDSTDSVWTVISGGGGSSGANQSLSNLTSPTAINQDLNMGTNSISNAGAITSSSADPADTGFIRMGNGELLAWEASPAHTTDGYITYNGLERFQFNATIVPDVSGGQTIGVSGMEWGTVYAQSLDISGPVLFNDSALFSTIVSNLIPSGTRSLGDATDEWEDLRIDGVAYIDTLSNIGDIIVSADLDFDTGKYPDLADTSTSVSGTGIQLPLNGSSNAACEGFVIIKVNGATKKIPYYS